MRPIFALVRSRDSDVPPSRNIFHNSYLIFFFNLKNLICRAVDVSRQIMTKVDKWKINVALRTAARVNLDSLTIRIVYRPRVTVRRNAVGISE